MTRALKAAIIGAGIGGLTTALCLQKFGIDAQVFERADALGEVGAGIQISPNGMKVLRALGLEDAVLAAGTIPRASQLRRGKSGRVILVSPMGADMERRFGAAYVHIHRAALVGILRDALETRAPDALHFGREFRDFTRKSEGITAKFTDGSAFAADVLIGADGIKSKVREILFGPDNPRFTGQTAWRFTVPVKSLGRNAPPPAASVWTGRSKHAVTYIVKHPLHSVSLANFVGVTEGADWREESWSAQGDKSEVLADFAGWHPVITAMIEQCEMPYKWALYDRPPLPEWNAGNAALLGDAAHPMLPFMAQGAVQALEDSFVLAQMLSSGSDIAASLAQYSQVRLPRTTRIQGIADKNRDLFHGRIPLGPLKLAGAVSPTLTADQLAWIYGHDVTA